MGITGLFTGGWRSNFTYDRIALLFGVTISSPSQSECHTYKGVMKKACRESDAWWEKMNSPPMAPYVSMTISMSGEKVARMKESPARMLPMMVILRQPYLLHRALVIGPLRTMTYKKVIILTMLYNLAFPSLI